MLIERLGGPDVFYRADVDVPDPAPDEVRLTQSAVGLNFVDIYHRTGQFYDGVPFDLPAILGVQAIGEIDAVGSSVREFAVGDRVGYVGTLGAYVSSRTLSARRVVRLPADFSDAVGAAALVRGLTAEYLLHRVHRVRAGETILVHAAAGGVGVILCQWAKALGATVIGTVSTPERAAIAAAHGCDYPLVYLNNDWVAAVREITGGEGVAVVYDSIGRLTFFDSLQCLRPHGTAVNFGTASGQVEEFALQLLLEKSLYVCRPTLRTFVEDRQIYESAAAAFFEVVRRGVVRLPQPVSYPLTDVCVAHRDFESRNVAGLPILIP
jgi:NADPH2:quinone reductase